MTNAYKVAAAAPRMYKTGKPAPASVPGQPSRPGKKPPRRPFVPGQIAFRQQPVKASRTK